MCFDSTVDDQLLPVRTKAAGLLCDYFSKNGLTREFRTAIHLFTRLDVEPTPYAICMKVEAGKCLEMSG